MRTLLAIILIGALFTTSSSAQELQGTLKDIQESGKTRIGYRQSLPPMSFLGQDGTPEGYSIDLCNHIAKGVKNKIGRDVRIEFIPVTAEDRFEALVTNRIDILCGATTVTLDRRENVDFTLRTFVTGGAYMTLKGLEIMNNFDGKKVGVEKGTTTAIALEKLFEETGTQAEIVLLNSKDQGLNALKKGEIDILSADQVVLVGLILKEDRPAEFTILPDIFSYDPIALAVRKNDADFRLIADRTLAKLYQSGQIETIYEKWFSRFAPKMPTALQASIKLDTIPEE